MEWISIVNTAGLLILGMILIHLKSYLTEKGKNLATSHNFEDLQKQLKASTTVTEQIKQAINRKESGKSIGINLLRAKIAEIDVQLLSWQIIIRFRSDELKPGETIEHIGLRDLSKVAKNTVDLHKLVSEYSIYINQDTILSIMNWSKEIYEALYSYDAAYNSSLKYNHGTKITDEDRFINLSTVIEENTKEILDKINTEKQKINAKFRTELDSDIS